MRITAHIYVLFITIISGYSQGIYNELDHSNFREYEPFSNTIDINRFDEETLNACIFFATNEIRAKKKLRILTYNASLEKASTIHSADMAEFDFFNHTNRFIKKHREPSDRAKVVGISNPHIAENIIEGFLLNYSSGKDVISNKPGEFISPKTNTPLKPRTYLSLTDDMMRQWMRSKGHRANILSDKALELGCGSKLFYMTNFNEMPAVKVTQNFQWFEVVKSDSN